MCYLCFFVCLFVSVLVKKTTSCVECYSKRQKQNKKIKWNIAKRTREKKHQTTFITTAAAATTTATATETTKTATTQQQQKLQQEQQQQKQNPSF